MRRTPFRSTLGAALLLSTTTLLHAQTPAMDADAGWSAVGRCAAVANERARHTCLDDVLRRAGLLTPQVEEKERRRQFGTPPASAAAPAAPEAQAEATKLLVEVASARRAPDGRLAITTAEGAVWRQTESVEMPQPPAAGDQMTIRQGALGGYRCSVARTNLTFRCERAP